MRKDLRDSAAVFFNDKLISVTLMDICVNFTADRINFLLPDVLWNMKGGNPYVSDIPTVGPSSFLLLCEEHMVIGLL